MTNQKYEMPYEVWWALAVTVRDYERDGCQCADRSLGFVKMPPGYALMLDADGMYFFWLSHDGRESCIHWNKWAVYTGAKFEAGKPWRQIAA